MPFPSKTELLTRKRKESLNVQVVTQKEPEFYHLLRGEISSFREVDATSGRFRFGVVIFRLIQHRSPV